MPTVRGIFDSVEIESVESCGYCANLAVKFLNSLWGVTILASGLLRYYHNIVFDVRLV